MLNRAGGVFLVFLRLGLTAFGGPVAHLGYFQTEFVERKKWIDESAYADLVALCQFLPGPASSQVGIALGLARAGYLGALAAWVGFTLPSAILLTLFAMGVKRYAIGGGSLHGLKVVAVAVVAQAIWAMATKLCPDTRRATIAVLSTSMVVMLPSPGFQMLAIIVGAAAGLIFLRDTGARSPAPLRVPIGKTAGAVSLVTFAGLLMALPIFSKITGNPAVNIFDIFFRAGSLVFGGGHVVLPLLHAEGFHSSESYEAQHAS